MELSINQDRVELDEAYMQMAEVWAKRSKGVRLQVGALIVKDRQIISDGYNGMPAGDPDDVCEYWHVDPNRDREAGYTGEIRTKPEVLHAESNALMKIAENGGVGAQGGTLYTTVSPCFECSKLIKQAKIKRVVFRHLYRNTEGIDMLLKRGVVVEQLQPVQSDPFAELRKPPISVGPVESAFQGTGETFLAPAPEIVRQPTMMREPTPGPARTMKPTILPGKPSDFVAKPKEAPPVLETPPIPKAPEPIVQEVSEAEIAAMIAAAGIPDPTKPAAPKKSSLADLPDDGVYKSPFL